MSGSAVILCTVLCGWDSCVHLQLCGLVPAVEEVHRLLNKSVQHVMMYVIIILCMEYMKLCLFVCMYVMYVHDSKCLWC